MSHLWPGEGVHIRSLVTHHYLGVAGDQKSVIDLQMGIEYDDGPFAASPIHSKLSVTSQNLTLSGLVPLPNTMMASQESVLITGWSNGGLGAALATAFHERGCKALATSRSLNPISKVSVLTESGVSVLQLDITSGTGVQAAKTAGTKETGDLLFYPINCVMIQSPYTYLLPFRAPGHRTSPRVAMNLGN